LSGIVVLAGFGFLDINVGDWITRRSQHYSSADDFYTVVPRQAVPRHRRGEASRHATAGDRFEGTAARETTRERIEHQLMPRDSHDRVLLLLVD